MVQALTLDSESAAADRRFTIRSEAESETIEPAKRDRREIHGQYYSDEEPRSNQLQIG